MMKFLDCGFLSHNRNSNCNNLLLMFTKRFEKKNKMRQDFMIILLESDL